MVDVSSTAYLTAKLPERRNRRADGPTGRRASNVYDELERNEFARYGPYDLFDPKDTASPSSPRFQAVARSRYAYI